LKITLAFAATALMAVLVSVTLAAMVPSPLLAALLSMIIAGALAAGIGYMFGGIVAQALADLTASSCASPSGTWTASSRMPPEIGDIAKALKAFQADAIRWSESHKSEQDSQIQGRLASQQRTEELIHQFRSSIAGILGAFADSARTMDETARALSTVASDTNERVGVVASASDEASANVQTVAATAEELAVSVGEIGTRVSTASRIVNQVTENARIANLKVEGLASAAQRIGDVVSLIQDVAAQTNLLALNATIEAARVGEAGRGFAVVASEVKTLADQTAKATDDIKQQIAAIQNSTHGAVEAMQSIVVTMTEVNKNTQEIAGAAAIGGNLRDLAQRAPGRARHRGRGGAYAGRDQGRRRDEPIGDADAPGLPRSRAPGRAAPPYAGELPAPGRRRRHAEARRVARKPASQT
jgi:methyl-accepting chemotaxis protein